MTITITQTSHILLTTQLTSLLGGVCGWSMSLLLNLSARAIVLSDSMVKILPCDSQWSISILVWFVVQWQSQEPWDNSVLSLYPVCVMAWSSPVLFGSPDKPSSVTSVGSPLASMPGKAVALQDSIFWKWDNAVICGLSLSFQHPGGFMFQE